MRHRTISSFGCISFALLLLAPMGAAAQAEVDYSRQISGPVEARVTKVRDGDTVEVEAFVWPMQTVHVAVRLKGIDAPEHRGKCPAEKHAADVATARLTALVGDGTVSLFDVSGGKYYGRVLARIGTADDKDLSKTLLKEGLVAPYSGGKRRNWCDGSLPDSFSAADVAGPGRG
ncbi:thermonuclease family protein [Jiella sp. M17.18]|uniref:thermonuclease family protein n=1 Tax=Jiella sp. M17.18 TaxID=3234247 RepID=UPI0034DF656D